METSGVFREDLARRGIEKARRVPEKYKSFSCGPDEAARRYAVKGPLLEALLDLGMPHARSGGQPLLDPCDLTNISMDLRLPTGYWSSTRLWSRSLRDARRNGRPRYAFTIRGTCPEPEHTGACEFRLDPALRDSIDARETSPGTFSFEASPILSDHDFGESLAPLIAEATRLEFHRLPSELSSDMGFLNDSGLANCQSATLRLSQVAAEAGITARAVMGLFVSAPYSIRHVWLEVRVGEGDGEGDGEGGWRHADPFFLNSLARWGVVSAEDWPLHRSPRFAVLPLASSSLLELSLLWHGRTPAPWGTAIMTAPVTSPAAAGTREDGGVDATRGPGAPVRTGPADTA